MAQIHKYTTSIWQKYTNKPLQYGTNTQIHNMAPRIRNCNMAPQIYRCNMAPWIHHSNMAKQIHNCNMARHIHNFHMAPQIHYCNIGTTNKQLKYCTYRIEMDSFVLPNSFLFLTIRFFSHTGIGSGITIWNDEMSQKNVSFIQK